MGTQKSKLHRLLDPHFAEIKTLILSTSTSLIVEELNRKYDCNITECELNNYLYNLKPDFDMVGYRKASNVFNFERARNEDANRQHQPRFR